MGYSGMRWMWGLGDNAFVSPAEVTDVQILARVALIASDERTTSGMLRGVMKIICVILFLLDIDCGTKALSVQ